MILGGERLTHKLSCGVEGFKLRGDGWEWACQTRRHRSPGWRLVLFGGGEAGGALNAMPGAGLDPEAAGSRKL